MRISIPVHPARRKAKEVKTVGGQPAEKKRRFQIAPGFVLRRIGDDAVLIPIGEHPVFTNVMMTPNKTAAFLWQAFSEPSTEEDVVLRALDRFNGEEADIRRDVSMFMKETLEKQVLVEVD